MYLTPPNRGTRRRGEVGKAEGVYHTAHSLLLLIYNVTAIELPLGLALHIGRCKAQIESRTFHVRDLMLTRTESLLLI